jgi:hypothetical protein
MEKSEKVILLSSIVVVGFVIAVFFHYLLGFYLKLGIPFNSFLCNEIRGVNLFFTDFNNLLYFNKDFAPYQNPSTIWVNYFPLAYILLYPFVLIKNFFISYLIYISFFLSFFIYMNIKMFKCDNIGKIQNFKNIFILSAITYPFCALLISGNFDMFLFIVLALFIYSFKSKKYLTAAILLGISNAIKPFFLIFGFLFLFEKKWKEFFLTLILPVFLTVLGFMILKGNFFDQVHTFLINLMLYKKDFIENSDYILRGSSDLFLALRYILCTVNKVISCAVLIKAYSILSSIVGVITLFFTFREKAFWKKITLMVLYVLTMSYVILDYKLIFLFIPLWLFINAKEKTKFDLIYTILFGLMLIPKKFLIIGFLKIILFSKIFNPVIMLIFMGLIIFEQFHLRKEVNNG